MSKDNNPEAQVEQTTSQETENENMVTIPAKELNDLQESNANLVAEWEALTKRNEDLTKENEDLKAEIESEKERTRRFHTWLMQEEDKVKMLKVLISAIPISSTTPENLVNRIVDKI